MPRTLTKIENGKLIDNLTDETIDRPAIFFDKDTGTLHGWGNAETVYARYDNMVNGLLKAGLPAMAKSYAMIELSGLTPEQQAYAVERCVETSATMFAVRLYEHMLAGDAAEWLDERMKERERRKP